MRKADTRQNSIVGLNLDYTCAAMLLRSIVVRVVYCFHALLIVLPSAPRAEGIGLCAARTASCLGYKRSPNSTDEVPNRKFRVYVDT